MAELDRFEKVFRAGWRSAFQWIQDGTATTEEIGDRLVKTLAKNLRTESGVPRLSDMVTIIENSNPAALMECFDAFDQIVRDENGHRHAKIAADVGKSLLTQLSLDPAQLTTDIPELFVERVCGAIVENRFFGKAEVPLVAGGKFSSYNEFRHWQEQLEQLIEPNLKRIADKLLRNPDADGLRAPPRMAQKKSTSELLRENLLTT